MPKKVKKTEKITKVFTSSKYMTPKKYKDGNEFGEFLLVHRNNLSVDFHKNLDKYIDFEFGFEKYLKHIRATYFKHGEGKGIDSNFDHGLCMQVFTTYSNHYQSMHKKMQFLAVEETKIHKYKRNTKYKKAGDVKNVTRKTKSTDLSTTLTHIARHGRPDLVEYMEVQLETNEQLSDSKRIYYTMILREIAKYGYARLYRLAMQHRKRFLRRMKVIEFKSLTFIGRSRKKDIVKYNKNFNSEINAFVSLSWDKTKRKDGLHIPISYSKDHFGDIERYHKDSPDYQYVVTFDERMRKINVNVMVEEDRYYDESVKTNFIGCDVNLKHNQFMLSDNTAFSHEDDLIKEYQKLTEKVERLKRLDKNYKPGKKIRNKRAQLIKKQKHRNEYNVWLLIQYLIHLGVDHIVMENIDGHMGRSKAKHDGYDNINYNVLKNFVRLGSLKDLVKRIGKKYGIDTSLIHAPYTSISCSCCGHIDKENRIVQEIFECMECDLKINGDLNAALNILYRVTCTVMHKLLKKSGNGVYSPKVLRREGLKKMLLSFRSQMPYYDKAEEYTQFVSSLTYQIY